MVLLEVELSCDSVTMRIEISHALRFITYHLYSKLPRRKVNMLAEELSKQLRLKYKDHWHVDRPSKGSGYRSLKFSLPKIDIILQSAAREVGLDEREIIGYMPADLIIWIDPGEVSYRIGERGTVHILYRSNSAEHRTQIEEKYKLDGSTDAIEDNTIKTNMNSVMNKMGHFYISDEDSGHGSSTSQQRSTPLSSVMTDNNFNSKDDKKYQETELTNDTMSSLLSYGNLNSPQSDYDTSNTSRCSSPRFTMAAFAQTKFGSTRLKQKSERPNRHNYYKASATIKNEGHRADARRNDSHFTAYGYNSRLSDMAYTKRRASCLYKEAQGCLCANKYRLDFVNPQNSQLSIRADCGATPRAKHMCNVNSCYANQRKGAQSLQRCQYILPKSSYSQSYLENRYCPHRMYTRRVYPRDQFSSYGNRSSTLNSNKSPSSMNITNLIENGNDWQTNNYERVQKDSDLSPCNASLSNYNPSYIHYVNANKFALMKPEMHLNNYLERVSTMPPPGFLPHLFHSQSMINQPSISTNSQLKLKQFDSSSDPSATFNCYVNYNDFQRKHSLYHSDSCRMHFNGLLQNCFNAYDTTHYSALPIVKDSSFSQSTNDNPCGCSDVVQFNRSIASNPSHAMNFHPHVDNSQGITFQLPSELSSRQSICLSQNNTAPQLYIPRYYKSHTSQSGLCYPRNLANYKEMNANRCLYPSSGTNSIMYDPQLPKGFSQMTNTYANLNTQNQLYTSTYNPRDLSEQFGKLLCASILRN